MISSSIRRVVLVVQPVPKASKLASNLSRAGTSNRIPSYPSCHQRRASSSKPPSPTDGSKGILESRPVASNHADASGVETKPVTTKKKAKSTAVKNMLRGKSQTVFNIPSVPILGPAAFFSLHRPISITDAFPQPVSNEAFASIFTPKSRSMKTQEVILALSNSVNSVDAVADSADTFPLDLQQNQLARLNSYVGKDEEISQSAEIQLLQASQILGQPQSFMSGKYTPFHPPQPPKPLDISKIVDSASTEVQNSHHRIYTALLTLEELTDSNGNITYIAHHSPLIADEQYTKPNPRPESKHARRTQYNLRGLTRSEMLAISVKRQRKLKMKKHKYKKLMRRTRNERRRLDRN
ncbi:putative duf1713 domain protein [Golovinomyces cichoracearum]|uniref:Small ribosomal subunit protein mS38 n=1 Tax=Golovinomyces cichoracearum TaxID=62708 RepID=A0A420J227_9PEZI|nr:putative duf1713 domain protein [Golovinomyces cichoracearum]